MSFSLKNQTFFEQNNLFSLELHPYKRLKNFISHNGHNQILNNEYFSSNNYQ